MEAAYSIVQKDNEYRVLLTSVNTEVLPERIQKILTTTGQDILHDITGWVAELFASNPNLIIYYSCDDMTPIPSRNKNSDNKDMPVNEYRSRLFTHIFDSYMISHQVSGVINTPIQLDNYEDGVGYSLFFHFIAREIHSDIVEMLKEDIKEVSGK